MSATLKATIKDEKHPFGLQWLDSCYQETFLPNGQWNNKIYRQLCDALAKKVGKQFGHPERKQMLFTLLGREFVKQYFPNELYDPLILAPPRTSPQTYKKLETDAQNWLRNVINMVAAEVKCQRPLVAEEKQTAQSDDMNEFLQHCRNMVTRGMDRQLFLQEREIVNAWEVAEHDEKIERGEEKESKKAARDYVKGLQEQHHMRGYSESGVRSILRNAILPPSRASTALSNATAPFISIKDAVFGSCDDPPLFWGLQSNTLGRSVLALLRRDPRRFQEVATRLHGRQLPGSLRTYIWVDVLLKKEREKVNDVNLEKIIRERFGKAVARGVAELNIKRATHSPISGLIDNAVIEIFAATPGMRMYVDDDSVLKESAKAMNVLYTYDKTYEPYLTYWLFPLQLAFQKEKGEGEHVYELAMYLDLLNRHCFPRWPEVFAMAESVMLKLQDADLEFHDHIKYIAQVEPHVNPKDFLVHLIHREKAKAEALLRQDPDAKPDFQQRSDVRLLADPLIFIRKWIGEGFVAVLDTQAAVYVWDQCFMQLWRRNVMENAALALLLLLRERFMDCKNYSEMKQVFMNDPCKLYTMDIKKAWEHLEAAGELKEVPMMNRQRPSRTQSPDRLPSRHSVQKSPTLTEESRVPLCPAGIKKMRLQLKFPSHIFESETWLRDFDSSLVRIRFDIYFGSVRLCSRFTSDVPVGRSTTAKYGAKTYLIDFPKERIILDEIDPSQLDIEQEMGGSPYVIATVEYQMKEDHKIFPLGLGWTRIKMYAHRAEVKPSESQGTYGRSQWVLRTGTETHILHAGSISERSMHGQGPVSPSQEPAGLIGPKSTLSLEVYDVGNEPNNTAPPGSAVHPSLARPTPQPQSPAHIPSPPPSDGPPDDAFDLYIDQLLNLPDGATIVKITGRILKPGALENIPDILAFPEVESSARNPKFKFRLPVNVDRVKTDVRMIVLLRVYTVDRVCGDLVVIGSCFFEVYDQDTRKLKLGAHARVIHHGMPDLSKGLGAIVHNCLDDALRIPGCCLRFRIEDHSEDYEVLTEESAYKLHDPEFSELETNIIESYDAEETVEEVALSLLTKEDKSELTAAELLEWMEQRLDIAVQLADKTPAEDINLAHLVKYRQNKGLNIRMERAFGMPEKDVWIQIIGKVIPDGNNEERIISLTQDLACLQKSPKWTDAATTLHPELQANSSLLVELHGLPIVFSPASDAESPATIRHQKKGMPLGLGADTLLGWTVIPLFAGLFVPPTSFQVPVFKAFNQELGQVINQVTEKGAKFMVSSKKWSKQEKWESTSLVITVWDGHFKEEELFLQPRKDTTLLEASGTALSVYAKAENDTKGKGRRVGQFLLLGLDRKVHSKGVINNPDFDAAVEAYNEAMKSRVTQLLGGYQSAIVS